jgi:pSer/pThr/pTyr-binding forkhead associated (FHA) protein
MAGTEVSVRDVGSLNGTYVNGVRVDKAQLSDGDVLQIGKFQMVFMNRGGA